MYFNGLSHGISNLLPRIFAHTSSIAKVFASKGSSRRLDYKWISWIFPEDGEMALNVDGSSLDNPRATGFGGIWPMDVWLLW
ncbi:hypothetical protein SESBI_07188 [Sesbania bispinosa]|nr:hypothetical protein SESBI_07188 [Sesbania bispinosa]